MESIRFSLGKYIDTRTLTRLIITETGITEFFLNEGKRVRGRVEYEIKINAVYPEQVTFDIGFIMGMLDNKSQKE